MLLDFAHVVNVSGQPPVPGVQIVGTVQIEVLKQEKTAREGGAEGVLFFLPLLPFHLFSLFFLIHGHSPLSNLVEQASI